MYSLCIRKREHKRTNTKRTITYANYLNLHKDVSLFITSHLLSGTGGKESGSFIDEKQ